MSDKIYGIDLGTTYSCISCVDEHGKPIIIKNSEGHSITPSVVFFDGDEIVVGDTAKESAKLYPNEVVSFVKRDMGDEHYLFQYNGKDYRPEEISSYILRKLVNDAEVTVGEPIKDVVITCPAYFGINEREATKKAGEIAGLNVRAVINEPTAAAIAYGSTDAEKDRVILVYDLGGGTFDVSMINTNQDTIEVICTGGDETLGGKDWDDRLVMYLAEQFKQESDTTEDPLDDPDTAQALLITAEKTKITLTAREKAPVAVTHGGERVKLEVTRDKFTELTAGLVEQTITLTQGMLKEAKKKGFNSFDEILLVGGSSRMPQIIAAVENAFSIKAKIYDPDEAVAKGAAIYGWKLNIDDELVKRLAHATGKTEEAIVGGERDNISDEVLQQAQVDIAKKHGLTLKAVKIAKQQIKNVVSKSFGIVVTLSDGSQQVANLILKNTTVPVENSQKFGTHEDGQDTVELLIMENEVSDLELALDLAEEKGKAVLGLPPGLPKSSPINITFKLNHEGRLEMTAVEESQGVTVTAVLETSSVISDTELKEAKERSKSIVVT